MEERVQHLRESPAEGGSHQSPSSERAQRDPRIEDYLDRVCAPLVDDVPYARRQELRAELGAHLEALAEAYMELGSPAEEAVPKALQRMGNPRRMGRQWAVRWERADAPECMRSFGASLRQALLTFGGTLAVAILAIASTIAGALVAVTPFALLIFAPAGVGLYHGRRGARRPVLTAGVAIGLLSLPCAGAWEPGGTGSP